MAMLCAAPHGFAGPEDSILPDVAPTFFRRVTVVERQQALEEALAAVEEHGQRDPALVWRTGVMVGGLLGEPHPGGLLAFERLRDAPASEATDLGPHVLRFTAGPRDELVEWEERIVETGILAASRSSAGIYRVRPTAEFADLLTEPIVRQARRLLRLGRIQGTELERHLIRVLGTMPIRREDPLKPTLSRMRPPPCATSIVAAEAPGGERIEP
jgi:hypothetical protein